MCAKRAYKRAGKFTSLSPSELRAKLTGKSGEIFIEEFQTLAELRNVRRSKINARKGDHSGDRGRGGTQRWLGAPSTEEVERRLSDGWPEGVRKVDQLVQSLDISDNVGVISRPKRIRVRKDFGCHVDIHSVYAGNLDRAWETTVRVDAPTLTPYVTIAVGIHAACSYSASEFFWRGAAAIALADTLMNSGRSVRIVGYYMGCGVYTDGSGAACSVLLKDFQEPLDKSRLIACVGMAGMFRHIGFTWMESHTKKLDPCYGYSVHSAPSADIFPSLAGNIVVIDSVWDKADTVRFVTSQVKSICTGVKV